MTQDLELPAVDNSDVFDDAVEQALIKFQRRHGLDPDGVVGTATLSALNVSVQNRMRQLELNMERWRWLPEQLGSRYILVNIANFTLEVVEQGRPTLAMRVIVGRRSRRTPFFSADMSYLVVNPHWHVPSTIAVQDKLPLIRKDSGYLARQRFKVFSVGGREGTAIDPETIDWSSVNAQNFSYRLRQDPGPRNALGRLKFMFPNAYHVYLHDTPERGLFPRTERAFSSGCIRLENPVELAEYLLRDDPQWSRQRILAAIEKGTEQVVRLANTIPVYLFYWTAWATDDGVMHFRPDIYARDEVLEKALHHMAAPREAEERRALAIDRRFTRFISESR